MRLFFIALLALVVSGASTLAATLPTVVVYPLQASAALDRDTNLHIVTALANEIAMDGRVRVVPADPDAQRADYLSAAKKVGAQFYVTGFITPLGDGASIIEQVVSTTSGTIVFSNSGQVGNISDVTAQGDILRSAILERASRTSYGSFSTGASGGPTPEPPHPTTTEPPEANIGGLFHHRKAAPKPTPSPSPSPAPTGT